MFAILVAEFNHFFDDLAELLEHRFFIHAVASAVHMTGCPSDVTPVFL